MSNDWIGWFASGILLLTLAKQIHKQWTEKNSEGVSRWLFIGQVVSEVAFIVYSCLLKNWVFVVTNSALLVVNFIGLGLVLKQKGHR